jgi:prepilin-type N-terminal cleavage/methylation domain-containing protein
MRAAHKLHRARQGFTLLEMMVAVALSIIVTAALYALFIAQSRQFMTQDAQSYMHQNLRFGIDILSRSARMAGYGTGGEVTGELGFDPASLAVSNVATLPAVISYDSWSGGTDAITIVYADPTLEMMTAPNQINACSTSGISFPTNRPNYGTYLSSYGVGDYVICWDYAPATGTESYLWSVQSAGNSSTGGLGVTPITAGVFTDFDAVCDPADENLPPVMHCSRAHILTFYIDNTDDGVGPGSPQHPVLMMDLDFDFPSTGPSTDDVPLVDDIEDLQISYCPRSLATAVGGCESAAAWTDSLGTTSGPYDGTEVWMVRFSLVARSMREDERGVYRSSRPSLENHSPTDPEDGYYRQVLTTAVTARNLRMMHTP